MVVFVEAREAVVWDLIPGRPRSDEEVELRAYARVAVECAEANGDSSPSGHSPPNRLDPQTEQNALTLPSSGPEDPDQFLSGEQAKAFARDTSLRSAKGSRVLSAPRAMAMIGPQERSRDFEANAAAQAGAGKRLLGTRSSGHVQSQVSLAVARQARTTGAETLTWASVRQCPLKDVRAGSA
jgi:hypothetical protein